jgi:hypothetical protein
MGGSVCFCENCQEKNKIGVIENESRNHIKSREYALLAAASTSEFADF